MILSAQTPGDAGRGRIVYEHSSCASCHLEGGQASDLLRVPRRGTGRAELAASMWTHAPAMWAEMTSANMPALHLSPGQTEDLYSYLYVERVYREPGNPVRGEKLLRSKTCRQCHDLTESRPAQARLGTDPLELAAVAWNHARYTRELRKPPRLTEQKVRNLVSYWQQRGDGGRSGLEYTPLSPVAGRNMFDLKGCLACHRYPPANRYPARTTDEFITSMWNHARLGESTPLITAEQMRKIAGYLWTIHYFDEKGDAGLGRKVFEKKACRNCHQTQGNDAPALNGRAGKLTGTWMISSLCEHGIPMRERMEQSGIPWPSLNGTEMADLLAYLNSLKWLQTREE